MKTRSFLFLLFLSLISFQLSAQTRTMSPNRLKIAQLIMELESNMKWETVDSEWADLRDKWIQQCSGTTDYSFGDRLSEALIQLAEHTRPEAMEQPHWQSRYTLWKQTTAGANLDFDEMLVKQLLLFESYLLWTSVSEEWAQRRDAWVAECKSIKNTAGEVNPDAEEEAMKFLGK
ncbi:MAG: hypothetical protein K1X92_12755 [Bacteroidia bacterium]|nr:hypothetical protein [Bacteroidia bacterium]